MPTDKDLKRIVRRRMAKTGESYTAARAHTLMPAAAEPDLAAIAGISDAAVDNKTGRQWKGWVELLDDADAVSLSHAQIADLLHTTHGMDSWWAQMVTVAYERIRGRREKGQRPDGTYDANKSKTYPVAVARLYRAFATARERARWMDDLEIDVGTSQRDKTMRFRLPDGGRVQAHFTAKGASKSSVSLQHGKLPTRDAAEQAKKDWADRLIRLGQHLKS